MSKHNNRTTTIGLIKYPVGIEIANYNIPNDHFKKYFSGTEIDVWYESESDVIFISPKYTDRYLKIILKKMLTYLGEF